MYELRSPVNHAAVVKYMGYYLIAFAFVLIVPMIAAVVLENPEAAIYYGSTAAAVFIIGSAIYRTLPDYELETKEALIIVAMVFPVSALLSAIPMALTTGMPFIDAYFESVSAVTTTGLSVAPADVGPVFLFARSWGQWVGGIGIILVVLSVLIGPGTTASRMYKANYGDMKIKPTVISTTRTLGKVYIIITLVSIILLLMSGMSLFDSICHALCCVSTGGFSTRPEGIAAYQGSLIPAAISVSCLLGAVSFVLYPYLFKKPEKIFKNMELRYFLAFITLGSIIFAFTLAKENISYNPIQDNLFQIISAITTAGFSTIDLSVLSEASRAVLIFMMWIGGNVGSTAGGIKVFRVLLLFKVVHNVLLRLFLPKETITPIKIEDHIVASDEIYNLVTFMLLYTLILIVSSFVFMLYGVDTNNSVFEVSSALSTVGLSAGATSAAMPVVLKLVLIIDMLFGRIEIIPLILLLMPGTWIKRKMTNKEGECMRVIVVGAGSLGINLTKNMIEQGNEVILIEKDETIAKELAETLDCTVINAEGTRPDILEKADIANADAVVACTTNDQNNILIGLIARDAKVGKVILKIDDKQFMDVASKLGFYYMINPSRISSSYITDVLRGINTIELSNLVRSDVRFMGIMVTDQIIDMKLSEISLPEDSAFIGVYRKSDFILAEKDPKLRKGDEIIIVTKAGFINDVNEALGRKIE